MTTTQVNNNARQQQPKTMILLNQGPKVPVLLNKMFEAMRRSSWTTCWEFGWQSGWQPQEDIGLLVDTSVGGKVCLLV